MFEFEKDRVNKNHNVMVKGMDAVFTHSLSDEQKDACFIASEAWKRYTVGVCMSVCPGLGKN